MSFTFWARVVKGDGCWLWTGPINPKGYGVIARRTYVESLAHRFAWVDTNGVIPGGLCVLHRCDTPACVNPAHLFLGTKADNNADMRAKHRGAHGETCGSSRLNSELAAAILKAAGSHRQIAEAFGVHQTTVTRIKNRRIWQECA